MANLRVRGRLVLLGYALLASGACGESREPPPPLYVVMQERWWQFGDWQRTAIGCMYAEEEEGRPVVTGNTFDGPPAALPGPRWEGLPESLREYVSLERSVVDDGLQVVISVNDEPLQTEHFTREFLERGELGRVAFKTPLGNRMESVYRRAPDCDIAITVNVNLFAE